MPWPADAVERTRAALEPLADPQRAAPMRTYMKDVAPFLGLPAAQRRKAQRGAWAALPEPSHAELWGAAAELGELPEREYHYAAIELLGRHRALLRPGDLDGPIKRLMLRHAWWDTVDMLGSGVINPLVAQHPSLVAVMWRWNGADDQWLIRASVQHQRGRRGDTDIGLLLAMCHPHAADRRFFVAKAIGWALRDLAAVDAESVRSFLADQPQLSAVARREALRGLRRADAEHGASRPSE